MFDDSIPQEQVSYEVESEVDQEPRQWEVHILLDIFSGEQQDHTKVQPVADDLYK